MFQAVFKKYSRDKEHEGKRLKKHIGFIRIQYGTTEVEVRRWRRQTNKHKGAGLIHKNTLSPSRRTHTKWSKLDHLSKITWQ